MEPRGGGDRRGLPTADEPTHIVVVGPVHVVVRRRGETSGRRAGHELPGTSAAGLFRVKVEGGKTCDGETAGSDAEAELKPTYTFISFYFKLVFTYMYVFLTAQSELFVNCCFYTCCCFPCQ